VRREDFRARATDDRQDGERLIDGLDGFSDVDRLATVRALARLAAGRAEVEVAPLVPTHASETQLIVRGAVLWQDLAASVPEGLVAGLQALPERSGLGQSVLALALLRAGDQTAARNTAERLMVGVGADEQVVAQAIRTRLGSEQAPLPELADAGGPTESETEGAPEEAAEGGNVAKPPPPPDGGASAGGGGNTGGSGGGGGGGGSFESLVKRGCEQVSSGDADAGIKTLLRAFDKNPRDVDVLVCLADGYATQGSTHHANQFYERALEQSPTNRGALRGAAKAAAKTGATQRAIGLYERLLKVDPNNAVALAYLANNKPGGAPPPSDPEPAPAPEGAG
jgi:tetratricopeptide (TPR) repeat protein